MEDIYCRKKKPEDRGEHLFYEERVKTCSLRLLLLSVCSESRHQKKKEDEEDEHTYVSVCVYVSSYVCCLSVCRRLRLVVALDKSDR